MKLDIQTQIRINRIIDSLAQDYLRENFEPKTCKESGWTGYEDGAYKKAKQSVIFDWKDAIKDATEFGRLDYDHDLTNPDLGNEKAVKDYINSL